MTENHISFQDEKKIKLTILVVPVDDALGAAEGHDVNRDLVDKLLLPRSERDGSWELRGHLEMKVTVPMVRTHEDHPHIRARCRLKVLGNIEQALKAFLIKASSTDRHHPFHVTVVEPRLKHLLQHGNGVDGRIAA